MQPFPQSTLERFNYLKKETFYSLSTTHHFLCSHPLATTDLLLSLDLPVLDILYKWNHICDYLWLVSFSQYNVFKVYPYCSIYQDFISFYCQLVFYSWVIPCFVYPLISWWLSCFSFTAIVNNTGTDTHVHVFMWMYVAPRCIPRNRISRSYGYSYV